MPKFDKYATRGSVDNADIILAKHGTETVKYTVSDLGGGGSVEGTAVLSTGEVGASKFLREDGDGTSSWQVPAGSGDVSKVGTPVNSQVGVWTGDGTIEGAASLTYDGSNLQLTGDVGSTGTKITKGWFADLELTNMPTIGGTTMNGGMIGIADAGGYFDATDVEAALQEDGIYRNFYNGSCQEAFNALVTSDGATVTLSVEKQGTGDLSMKFSDGVTVLDCTPAATIALTEGSTASPQSNYIYIPQSTKVLTKSTTTFPTNAEHIKIGYFLVQTAAYVQSDGCLINQNWNDSIMDSNNMGHMLHIAERSRHDGAYWFSGVGPNGTSDYLTISAGTVNVKSTAGVVWQMHRHAYPAKDTSATDDVHIVNWNGDAYHETQNLHDIVADSTGASLSNKWFGLTLWGVANKGGEYGPLMVTLPSGGYNTAANAQKDANDYANFSMPREFNRESSTGFLIAHIIVKQSATWSYDSYIDLRGMTPQSATGGATGSATSFADNAFEVYDESDITKILVFQASGITTGNTRTMTVPDASGTIALTADKLSAFATTTSAELANTISDETGSGALTFANTPTLVTPELGAATGTSVTLGTASATTGSMVLKNSTNANMLTVQPGATSTTYAVTLPTAVASAGQFLKDVAGDGVLSWATPGGGGDVSKVGTPVDSQVGVWTGDGSIEGDAALTFDTSTDTLTTGILAATTVSATALGGTLTCADNIVTGAKLKDYSETEVAGGAGGNYTFDLANGNVYSRTVNATAEFTFSNPIASGDASSFTMILTNGGSETITWPTSVDWQGGTAPTLTAAGVDILVFTTIDGGTIWHGMVASTDSK